MQTVLSLLKMKANAQKLVISFACISSETQNLQRVFRPRGSPLYRLYRYVPRQRICFFKPFWSEIGYQF